MPSHHTNTPAGGKEADPVPTEPADPPVRVPLKLEDTVSVATIAALALITFCNVLVRYLTNASFAWTEEISIFLLIVLTLTASATGFVRNQHIRIEAYADSGSAQKQRRLAIANHTIVLLFFILLTILSARIVYDDYTWGDTSPAIGVPTWWYSVWMPLLGAVITLRVAGSLQRALRSGRT